MLIKSTAPKNIQEKLFEVLHNIKQLAINNEKTITELFSQVADLRSAVKSLQERQHRRNTILHAFEVSFLYHYHIILQIIRRHYPKIPWLEIVNVVKQTSPSSLESAHRPSSPKIVAKRHEFQSFCSIDLDKLLCLDEGHKSKHSHATSEKKEGNFFHEHSQLSTKTSWDDNVTISSHSSNQSLDKSKLTAYFLFYYYRFVPFFLAEQQTEGPSIDQNAFNNDGSVKTLDPKKKQFVSVDHQQRKGKVLVHKKVTAYFKEIERNIQEQEKFREQQAHLELKNRQEAKRQHEKDMTNLKFGYQYINKRRELEEAKLKQSNPKKAEQMERFGMGFANRSGVSHSAMTDMQTIQQEGVTTTRTVSLAPRNRDFFDDYEPAGFSSRSKVYF
ncbi:unnamed protein product [Rotaria sp. Silwood2]|nr:unnamed protein product [Rotaria sp. Silwood2]